MAGLPEQSSAGAAADAVERNRTAGGVATLAESLLELSLGSPTELQLRVHCFFDDDSVGETMSVPVRITGSGAAMTIREVLTHVTRHYRLEYWSARTFKVFRATIPDGETGARFVSAAKVPVKDFNASALLHVKASLDAENYAGEQLIVHIPKPRMHLLRVQPLFDDNEVDNIIPFFVSASTKVFDVVDMVLQHYRLDESQRSYVKIYKCDNTAEQPEDVRQVYDLSASKRLKPEDSIPATLLESTTVGFHLVAFIPLAFENGALVNPPVVKNLVEHGLPPLQNHGDLASSDRPSVPSSKESPPCKIADEALPDVCIDDAAEQYLLRVASASWATLKSIGGDRLTYSSEASICGHVISVLRDVQCAIRHLLGPDYSLRFEEELKVGLCRPDAWAVLVHGKPVGVIEVKKPMRDNDRAMNDQHIIGECFDNMVTLRSFDGIDHVYCILTSYQQWRILCLCDASTLIDFKSTEMPSDPIYPPSDENFFRIINPSWPWVVQGMTALPVRMVHNGSLVLT